MATKARNNITRSVNPGSIFEDALSVVSSAVSWNQGDLLRFDDTANLVKAIASDAEGSTFLGVAVNTVSLGKLLSPYTGTAVDAAQAVVPLAGPRYGVIVRLIAKTGDAFAPGDSVFATATDAQTVSSAGTKAIGVYVGATIASATAGQEIEVRLGHRHPGDVLVM